MSDDHIPVLRAEVVELMVEDQPRAVLRAGVFIDATFGRGGHSRGLLERLGPHARLVAVDRDGEAVAAGLELAATDPRVTMQRAWFSSLREICESLALEHVDGIIMDLGVSSPQLDDGARGFSFRTDAPLDMRMDQSRGETGAEWLNRADAEEIAWVLKTYGEERFARRIAAAIVRNRPIDTTQALARVVEEATPSAAGSQGRKHDATRVFQAIRIHVNNEMKELSEGLRVAFDLLAPGGRLLVVSFHSLEDRQVKRFFRDLSRPERLPRRLPVKASELNVRARSLGRPIRAGVSEVRANPRARSAILRGVARLG